MIVESGWADFIALKGSGCVLKRGDHGAFKPMTNKLITNTVTHITPYTAHGLFNGLLSPLLDINGIENKITTVKIGRRMAEFYQMTR
jgi:hypothetical protein